MIMICKVVLSIFKPYQKVDHVSHRLRGRERGEERGRNAKRGRNAMIGDSWGVIEIQKIENKIDRKRGDRYRKMKRGNGIEKEI